jgi:biotin-(acetyl-CoA carboxylase) ligase
MNDERPVFPPLFRPFAVTPELDPFERCLTVARDGAEPGTLLWSIGTDAAECAIVLAPEQSLEHSLPIVMVAALGIGDALGALLPPVVAVTFGWPDRVEINGAVAGGVRMAMAEVEGYDQVPDWMVIGFGIAVQGQWAEGASVDDLRRTTLADEGANDVVTLDLLEGFSRHFLSWINRWQDDGIGPVHQAWLARATGLGKTLEVEVGDRKVEGTFAGLTESGGLRLVKDGITQTVPLDEAMQVPTWAV